jgi:putative tryptophan/tyrosine transport system substrate-binding protein
MKNRWRILVLGTISLTQLAVSPAPKSPHRIAIVIEGQTKRIQPQEQGLSDGLAELGYVDGKQVVLDRLQGDEYKRIHSMLASYVQTQRPDLIVTLGTTETSAAKGLTQKIPIVFLPAGDPVSSGFVQSLAKPATNLTGLTFYTSFENIGKQLEVFKDVVKPLRRVIALLDESDPTSGERLKKIKAIAPRLGIELTERFVRSVVELAPLRKGTKTVGLFSVCSGLFKDLDALASVARKHRLPLFGCNAFQVAEQKVLLSYAPDLYLLGYRGAWFVDQILKGAKPQTLPVETPAKFDLVINQRTAAEIGLTIAPHVLMLADRVFE